MASVNDRELMLFATPAEFEKWITANRDHEGIRVQLRKKSSTKPGMLYSEALDVALCHGWIDGQKGALDEDYFFNGFSPRRTRSPWSQVNRDHVTRLIAEGRMTPHGLAEVDRAKADGRWDAAYRQKDAEVPADLQLALDANPAALAMFAKLSSQNRFAILFRIGNVKRAETRAAKIAGFVEMLARGETIYPQK